jgi:glutamine deamidase
MTTAVLGSSASTMVSVVPPTLTGALKPTVVRKLVEEEPIFSSHPAGSVARSISAVASASLQADADDDSDLLHAMSQINKTPAKDKDQELASRFQKFMNGREDGYCSSYAFNTHLLLMGQKIKKTKIHNNGNFKVFGDWFYEKFCPAGKDDRNTIISEQDETYGAMKNRVVQKVKELTKPHESVLISIAEGAHWFNAYNDGIGVWFIDSQSGRGFNLYADRNPEEILDEQVVDIVRVSPDHLSEYYKGRKNSDQPLSGD